MRPSKLSHFAFFVAVVSILCVAQCSEWQGYGNMSSSNLTDIWGYIDARVNQVTSDALSALGRQSDDYYTIQADFATNISDHLNKLWNPAWNVFVIQAAPGKDCILYGYGFRDHWMWYNGYRSNGMIINFIIWKDYNCQVWKTFNGRSQWPGTLSTDEIKSALVGVNDVNPNTDIWGKTKKFMNQLVTKDSFKGEDKAFTVIASEDFSTCLIIGRVCIAGDRTYFLGPNVQVAYNTIYESLYGRFVIFQMR